jgi:hypothetical protein
MINFIYLINRSIGEDLPGLVLDEQLHGVDRLGPGVDLGHHHLDLVPVQDAGLHPGQVHRAVHLHRFKITMMK